jgi:hypothetical protein
MATKLTRDQREAAILDAWRLSIRGVSIPKIAKAIGLSEVMAANLVNVARKRSRTQNVKSLEDYLEEFVCEQRAVMEDAWRQLTLRKPGRQPASSLHATILNASKNIATARGVFIERRDVTSGGESLIWTDLVREVEAENRARAAKAREADTLGNSSAPTPKAPDG